MKAHVTPGRFHYGIMTHLQKTVGMQFVCTHTCCAKLWLLLTLSLLISCKTTQSHPRMWVFCQTGCRQRRLEEVLQDVLYTVIADATAQAFTRSYGVWISFKRYEVVKIPAKDGFQRLSWARWYRNTECQRSQHEQSHISVSLYSHLPQWH